MPVRVRAPLLVLKFVKILAYVRIFLYISTMNKITRKYEDEDTISIWTYDTDKFKNGPISVEIKYKHPPEKKQTNRERLSKKK